MNVGVLQDQWSEHRAQWSGCTRCRLHNGRRSVVLGRGNLRPRHLFVGIGPGEVEDRKGLPFVGPAGRLLDRCILEAGGTPRACFFLNLVACRPTEDGISNRNPRDDEVGACWSRLTDALSIVRPRESVILLGHFVQAYLEEKDWISGIKIHRLWHPAYVVRLRDREPQYIEMMKEVFA